MLGEPTVDGAQPTHVDLSIESMSDAVEQLSAIQSAFEEGSIVSPYLIDSKPIGHSNCVQEG